MRRIPIEMLLVLLLVGVAMGIAWSRWMGMEAQIANHNARLVCLEADLVKRSKLKRCVKVAASFAVECVRKISFGVIRSH